jgi:hypothetical protein
VVYRRTERLEKRLVEAGRRLEVHYYANAAHRRQPEIRTMRQAPPHRLRSPKPRSAVTSFTPGSSCQRNSTEARSIEFCGNCPTRAMLHRERRQVQPLGCLLNLPSGVSTCRSQDSNSKRQFHHRTPGIVGNADHPAARQPAM